MFGIPMHWIVAAAMAGVGSLAAFKDYWIPYVGSAYRWVTTRKTTERTADPYAAMDALQVLCGYYKGDAESAKAIRVLKERFLLVPGAGE